MRVVRAGRTRVSSARVAIAKVCLRRCVEPPVHMDNCRSRDAQNVLGAGLPRFFVLVPNRLRINVLPLQSCEGGHLGHQCEPMFLVGFEVAASRKNRIDCVGQSLTAPKKRKNTVSVKESAKTVLV